MRLALNFFESKCAALNRSRSEQVVAQNNPQHFFFHLCKGTGDVFICFSRNIAEPPNFAHFTYKTFGAKCAPLYYFGTAKNRAYLA